MVVKVVYIAGSESGISDICSELASVIISNKSSAYRVALAVRTNSEVRFVVNLSKLTVALVSQFREAHTVFAHNNCEIDEDFADHTIELFRDLTNEPFDAIIVKADKVSVSTNPSIPLSGTPLESIPVREVKPVKTFDGHFTIGDPQDPLLKLPICLYPAVKRATAPEMVTYVGKDRVVRSSELKTESGKPVNFEKVFKGYRFLNDIIPVDSNVQELMDGEFEGAIEWPQAFELLATVPEIPPWIPFEKTDVLVGRSEQAQQFFASFARSLSENRMHALVRMCSAPRTKPGSSEKKRKGKVTLVALVPKLDNSSVYVVPVPFKEDFKSFYRFKEISSESDGELDADMDALVDGMTIDAEPSLIRNQLIERTYAFLQSKIATGEGTVPPKHILDVTDIVTSDELVKLSQSLASRFGISMENEAVPDEAVDFEFI